MWIPCLRIAPLGRGIPTTAKDPKDKSADWLTILLWLVVEPTPLKKYARQKGESSPNRGENKTYLKPPTSSYILLKLYICMLTNSIRNMGLQEFNYLEIVRLPSMGGSVLGFK